MHLNLVFHDIVLDIDQLGIGSRLYTLTTNQLETALGICSEFTQIKFRFYFDDGYTSFYDLALPLINQRLPVSFCVSIVTDWIGTPGYMSLAQVQKINCMGVEVASHGCSHASLVRYNDSNNNIIPTAKGGTYQNMPLGKTHSLSEQEVLYQLRESKRRLNEMGIEASEFVFPYGLYSESTVELNNNNNLYNVMTTCDSGIDIGQVLRPRILLDRHFDAVRFRENLWEILKLACNLS